MSASLPYDAAWRPMQQCLAAGFFLPATVIPSLHTDRSTQV
jgi:hypothetical protein